MSIIKPYEFYPKDIIEQKANQLLIRTEKEGYRLNWGRGIVHQIVDVLELKTLWDIIPNDDQGQIVAKIEPLNCLITLNENISKLKNDEGFQQSTIAHEIGHWILHINQHIVPKFMETGELYLDDLTQEKLFLCRVNGEENINKIKQQTENERREWQAQYFASCLLMPEDKLQECIKGRDLTNWKHLYPIANELCVTISNLVYRLQNLGWIYLISGSKQIYKGRNFPHKS